MRSPDIKVECRDCAWLQLCLPIGIDPSDFELFDRIIKRRRPMRRGERRYRAGAAFGLIDSSSPIRSRRFPSAAGLHAHLSKIVGFWENASPFFRMNNGDGAVRGFFVGIRPRPEHALLLDSVDVHGGLQETVPPHRSLARAPILC